MILNMSILVIGWILEIAGILIIAYSSTRLSHWIFENWTKSTNEELDKEKKSLKKSQKKYQIIAICIIIIGLYLQLHVMFLPIDIIADETTTIYTNIDPELTNTYLLDRMYWSSDNRSGNISDTNGEFELLRNIFDGYDELAVFESEQAYGDFIFENTEILLSKFPLTVNTTYQDYIYYQNGITIKINHNTSYPPDDFFEGLDYPEIKLEVGPDIKGILYQICDTSFDCKESYDGPAQYQFWTEDKEIIITGFLTDDQIALLAHEVSLVP